MKAPPQFKRLLIAALIIGLSGLASPAWSKDLGDARLAPSDTSARTVPMSKLMDVNVMTRVAQGDDLPPAFRPKPIVVPADNVQKEATPQSEPKPVFKELWFWGLVGGLAVVVVTAGVLASSSNEANPARGCQKGVVDCFGDGR